MIRWTSQKAFHELDLGTRQRQVLKVLCEKDMSNREIMRETGLEINAVTPRCLELRELGLVVEKGSKVDPETKKTVLVWGVPLSGQLEMNL